MEGRKSVYLQKNLESPSSLFSTLSLSFIFWLAFLSLFLSFSSLPSFFWWEKKNGRQTLEDCVNVRIGLQDRMVEGEYAEGNTGMEKRVALWDMAKKERDK